MKQPVTIMDDSIALSAVLETPEDAGCTSLAIILHGFTSAKDRIHTLQTAEAIRETGTATMRFDLYGHGESDGEFRKHTLYKWISNTMAVIDWARQRGYTDLCLSGHSQGGLVAALVAGMEPDRIRGLILRAPAFMIPEGARKGSLLGYHFDPDHIPDAMPVIKDLELEGNYARVAQTIRAEETAERYKGPVLIIHGDEDDLVPLQDSQQMAQRYADCKLAVMRGETHHCDRHPAEMQDLIRQFIILHR